MTDDDALIVCTCAGCSKVLIGWQHEHLAKQKCMEPVAGRLPWERYRFHTRPYCKSCYQQELDYRGAQK